MARILVSDPVHPDGLARLREHGHEVIQVLSGDREDLLRVLPGVEGWMIRSRTKVTAELLEHAPHLKIVVRVGVGLDNVDLEAASRRGVLVANTPRATTRSVAEHTLALMLAASRNLLEAGISIREGRWEKKRLIGRELQGKVVGLVGVGRIGSAVARLCRVLGMEVVGHDPQLTPEMAADLGVTLMDLETLLSRSDIISLHVPLTEETRHMINHQAFARMKEGVILVNCARGGIVDEKALLEALEAGRVAMAALDVFEVEPPPPDYPLLHHPRVIATPHIAAQTEEAQRRAALEAADKIIATLGGEDALG